MNNLKILFRCEVWARNGFCGSKTFYGAYIRQTCNASCGCTNITEPLTFCQQLAGRAADVGPFPCPTGVTGINVNGSCCVVPGTPAGSQLTCAAIHGENIGPCTVDATSTFSSCGGSDTCICPDTTALNCQCCRTRPNTKLSCQAVIGAFPPTLTPSPTGPAVQCTSNTQCTALNAQCIEGQCCQF
uniref:EB domain-containing protein n=1 Tax=Acrobeloides nanus TaxID=290746 RepID=A0A914DPP9_9BILA